MFRTILNFAGSSPRIGLILSATGLYFLPISVVTLPLLGSTELGETLVLLVPEFPSCRIIYCLGTVGIAGIAFVTPTLGLARPPPFAGSALPGASLVGPLSESSCLLKNTVLARIFLPGRHFFFSRFDFVGLCGSSA